MTQPNETAWGWWASRDGGEYYQIGPEATRQAAIDAATAEEYGAYQPVIETNSETGEMTLGPWRCKFEIMEAMQHGPVDLSDHFAVNDWFEEMDNGTLGEWGDPGGDSLLSGITTAQIEDLENRVKSVIREWQGRHNIEIHPWAFAASRNAETIDVEMRGERPQ